MNTERQTVRESEFSNGDEMALGQEGRASGRRMVLEGGRVWGGRGGVEAGHPRLRPLRALGLHTHSPGRFKTVSEARSWRKAS